MSVSEALYLACGQNPPRYLGKMMTLAIMKDCLVCGRKFNILDRKHFCSDPCAADAGDISRVAKGRVPFTTIGSSRPNGPDRGRCLPYTKKATVSDD